VERESLVHSPAWLGARRLANDRGIDTEGGRRKSLVDGDGTAWSAALDIDSTRVIDAVSYPTVNFCAAVDTSGYGLIYQPVTFISEYLGHQWRP
jgi:hypothetical protein